MSESCINEKCPEVPNVKEAILPNKLSHKQWRRHLKKMRRQESRREMARERERGEEEEDRRNAEDEYYKVQSKVEAKRKEEEEKQEEAKRAKEHDQWLKREKDALDEIKQKDEEEQEKTRLKEEAEQRIREEWEAKDQAEKEEREKKQELLNSQLNDLERQQQNTQEQKFSNPPPRFNKFNNRGGGQNNDQGGGGNNYHHYNNPPTNWQPTGEFFLPEQDPRNCKFYIKTGACRFGQRCSRTHLKYENSPTILIQNFFSDARLAMPMLNEKGNDTGLEYDEVEMIHDFEKFYDDVIGEFRAAGTVVMFKCCQNFVNHLRGNVYVQYSKVSEAREAIRMFNGRFYAGRMLSVDQSPVTNWKSSICGLFDKRLCPRGKACNFLHVFRNPGNAYSVPNRTDFDPERAFRSGGYDPRFVNPKHPVFQYYSQRDAYGYRSSDMKKKNKNYGYGRNTWDSVQARSRSRSRDRRHHRSRSRGRSRSRSRSRDSRSYSRSRSRSRRRRRSRSRTRSRSRSHDRSKRKHSRSSSRSSRSSRKRSSRRDSEVSDTSTDWSDLSEEPIK